MGTHILSAQYYTVGYRHMKISKNVTKSPFIVTSVFALFNNFALSKNKNDEKQMDIPAELYEDEVVCFIADRYHTTSQKVVQCFLAQEGITSFPKENPETFHLENNELAILRGLIRERCTWSRR